MQGGHKDHARWTQGPRGSKPQGGGESRKDQQCKATRTNRAKPHTRANRAAAEVQAEHQNKAIERLPDSIDVCVRESRLMDPPLRKSEAGRRKLVAG